MNPFWDYGKLLLEKLQFSLKGVGPTRFATINLMLKSGTETNVTLPEEEAIEKYKTIHLARFSSDLIELNPYESVRASEVTFVRIRLNTIDEIQRLARNMESPF